MVNALIHRDYLVSAPVRLFVYDNRIEIISPGHLPDNLTMEKIRTGIANIRNPILVSYEGADRVGPLRLLKCCIFFVCDVRGCRSIPALALKLDLQSECGTLFRLEGKNMNITNDIKPVTYLKSRTADLLRQINETHRPVIITQNGEPRAVLQDPQSYENMRNALGLLKLISIGEADIREGRTKSQDEIFDELEGALKESCK